MKNYNQYFLADSHFGHEKITTFLDSEGKHIRPYFWQAILLSNWRKKVKPEDRVYILGDVVIKRKNLVILDTLPGKKYLIKGNHDLFQIKDYIPYFKDIRAYKVMSEHNIIFSHMPIHLNCLESRFKFNVHGHMHQNIINDKKYLNVCVENINYDLLSLEEILNKLKIGE